MARVVFMGTPDFAVPALSALITHHEVVGVVTQPDRPAGRGSKIRMSPIKEVALKHQIPVFQPEKLRREAAIDELNTWTADVYVVAAFGQILPQAVLDIPPYGCLNVHASVLPRWRGAAPIQAAIRAGDAMTGVTIMKMDAGLDTGPILAIKEVAIAPDETGESLHDRLSEVGAELLIDTLPGYMMGDIQPVTQPEDGVTHAPQIRKEDGLIDWTASAPEIERTVRAFTPWPGTFTYWQGQQLKVHRGVAAAGSAAPGEVVSHGEAGAAVGTGQGVFSVHEVQLEGKKRVAIADFLRGYPEFVGATLGAE
ncbi:MAG: methionyl-tRNA formyltransferase [Chloroflexota bacterium]